MNKFVMMTESLLLIAAGGANAEAATVELRPGRTKQQRHGRS